MHHSPPSPTIENNPQDEMTLYDLFSFCSQYWKMILGLGLMGSLLASLFLAVVKPQYKASALMEMSQINSNIEGLGNNIESPARLIERLQQPTTYTPETIKSCQIPNSPLAEETMAKIIQAKIPKNLTSAVELSVRRPGKDFALQCVKSVFDMIHQQQIALLLPHQEDMHHTLKKLQARLKETQAFIANMEQAGLYQTIYLARKDESLYLIQQIDELERTLLRASKTRLIAPIYVSAKPVYPKTVSTLLIGTIGGLLLGGLLALVQQTRVKQGHHGKIPSLSH